MTGFFCRTDVSALHATLDLSMRNLLFIFCGQCGNNNKRTSRTVRPSFAKFTDLSIGTSIFLGSQSRFAAPQKPFKNSK